MITTTVDFLSFTHIPPIHLQQIYSILYLIERSESSPKDYEFTRALRVYLTLRSKSSPKDYAFTNALRVYLIERSESSPKDYEFTRALRVYLIERSESSPKDYVIVLTTFDRIKEMWYTLCKK